MKCNWLLLAMAGVAPAFADGPAAELEPIQVTATREAEPVDKIPASVTVISGEEMRKRGVIDLRTAFLLAGGVEGTPGGDGGPAGAVPSIWGLREADAFLLVVDGVPWGGAFNPATPAVDLADVERIEILRGAAPVMFGATSFSGVIHVIHYKAGETPSRAAVSGGTYGSYGASGATTLSSGAFKQSLMGSLEKQSYREDDTRFSRYHALYRGAADLGAGTWRLDGDVTFTPQKPDGNLLLRDGTTLYDLPRDANYNPDDAKLNQQRFHLVTGFDAHGWGTTLAVTRTLDDINRGFVRGGVFTTTPPNDAGVGDGLQADGYTQKRGLTDVYFDVHAFMDFADAVKLTYGVDFLYGYGSQNAINYGYCTDVDGHEFACPGAHHADEIVHSDDTRYFGGLYGQMDWEATETLDVLLGVRLNRTRETTSGVAIDNTGPTPVIVFQGSDAKNRTRPSGTVGVSWKAWSGGKGDLLTLYTDYRNTYKPLAIDFGPEGEAEVLNPETAAIYEAGAKTRLLDGRLDVDTSVFQMDFKNGLTFVDDGTGTFVRANGGETRFLGAEIETRFTLFRDAQLAAHFANHDARFRRFMRDNGAPADGNQVEMSPYNTGGVGLLYLPATGPNASLIAGYAGPRKLNKSNSVRVGGYTMLDATLGWRFDRFSVGVNGYNLTDRRDPVAESELQELTVTGTAGYYRLQGRQVMLNLGCQF